MQALLSSEMIPARFSLNAFLSREGKWFNQILLICALLLSAIASAQCFPPPGNQTSYGAGNWIGYVYSGLNTTNPPTNALQTSYMGYITQPEIFNQNVGAGSISGPNLCGSHSNQFSIRYKMQKTFAPGNYLITVGGDDGYRLSIDGGATFVINNWFDTVYSTTSNSFFLSGTVNLILEYYEQGGESQVSFSYQSCGAVSSAPTSILGTSAICSGTSTTLTAQGGTGVSGSTFQWGTGTVVGNNIITGQTGASLTISPTNTTTYWVCRVDAAPCTNSTAGITQAVTVNTPSTAPTAIAGLTNLCLGNSTTLTASGGTLSAGAVYEWGTGSVIGNNVITGQTNASIVVAPTTSTTYWVRRKDIAPCTTASGGLTVDVSVAIPGGDQAAYGADEWIGYVYSDISTANPPANPFSTTYRGYINQTEIFSQNVANGVVSGPNLCGTYAERFSIRYKMTKNLPAGYYVFTAGGDDGYRLSIDGGATFLLNNWNEHSYASSSTTSLYLSGTTNFVLEYYEATGDSNVSFTYTYCPNFSTAPTAISGITAICAGTSTTLTATGGQISPNGVYQWGTGATVGNNVIAGQTSESITVSPATTTTYWVRRIDVAPCPLTTNGVSQIVNVSPSSAAPTLVTGTLNICNGGSTTLTASGGSIAAGSVYQWGTGAIVGDNIISGFNTATVTLSPTVTTTYWIRRIDANPCTTPTSGILRTVNVAQRSIAPTSISGSLCGGNGGTTLTAIGGTLGTNGTYQWGTGTVIGSSIIASNQLFPSIFVNPTASTTYWVRIVDAAPCSASTTGVTATVAIASIAPASVSGNTTICNGNSTTLTAIGGTLAAGAVYQWGTGATEGVNIISGQTTASIVVTPSATTTYWVRIIDGLPCSTASIARTTTVTVNSPSTAPTSISGTLSICSGSSTVLTAEGAVLSPTATYQWGIGLVAGATIIAGQTGPILTVSPTVSTNYWVRVIDIAPCSIQTAIATTTVTINTQATAPTSITGITTICNGLSTTLTAVGGSLGTNGSYEWGTGSIIGANIITGNTNIISVSPTVTTVYWVRKVNAAPCSSATSGLTATVTVINPSIQPTSISGTAEICVGTPITLTAVGGTVGIGAAYQWGTGYTVGSGIIAGQNQPTLTVTPSVSTVYWVRIIGGATCIIPTWTVGPTFPVTVRAISTAPTSITGAPAVACPGNNVILTANGGITATGATFEWGTGPVVGSNIIAGQNWSTIYVTPLVNTTYWVRKVDVAPCTTVTTGITVNVNVAVPSVQPTSITGSATICAGTSTVLTAAGGTPSAGATYQWGTGWTVGINIIAGQTASSITVSPTVATVYWVRIMDASVCPTPSWTWGPTLSVSITSPSTAPTTITASNLVLCLGNSTTLTASGGTAASGSTYQWGTGTVGSNIIAGQTGNSIVVTPSAVSTTYWVRRKDNSTCTAFTGGTSIVVLVKSNLGNPANFGNNTWNVYGYSTGDITLATAIYAGYYTQNTLGFDTQSGTNSWNNTLSPSSSAGWQGCSVPTEDFTFVHKRRGFPCGTYLLTLTNWDDASTVYIDGTLVWSCANWSGAATCSGLIGTFTLTSTSTIEVRTRENTGFANAALTITNVSVAPTAPTSIAGTTGICSGSSTTLIASGGLDGTTSTFEWGTGSVVGLNIITGANSSTLTVSPSTSTVYWVRRKDITCGNTTSGVTQMMSVALPSVAGILTSPVSTLCKSTMAPDITLSGYIGNILKWQSANNASFTSGVVDIVSTSAVLPGTQIGSLTTTKYFRAFVQNSSCSIVTTAPISIIIPNVVTFSSGVWSETPNESTPVIITGNLLMTSDLTMCSCKMAGNSTLTIPSGVTLTVEGEVQIMPNSNLIIENNGSLVQVDDLYTNTGSALIKRNTTPMKQFDYTYWSSPVQSWTLNQLSPNTLSDKYFSYNAVSNGWAGIPGGTDVMEAGKGYIVRAPQGWSLTNATLGVFNGNFSGVPNTGVVPVTIKKGAGSFNLIGNPYPSAVDIDLFLLNAANRQVVNGTIYLWTHNTAISSSNTGNAAYNYVRDDYAKYNITGGVQTAASSITGGVIPSGKIASGQAFFIEAKTSLAAGTYSANFTNEMRVGGNNGQFFKNENMSSSFSSATSSIEKHRLWLHMTNSAGAFDQMLLGYIEGATNDVDELYDGKTFPAGNVVGLYSLLGATKLSIQGRALPFSSDQIIPLGYTTTIASTFTIGLDNFDGVFDDQNVYLYDKSDSTYHNLKDGSFSFSTIAGTFDDRFELRFTNGTLGTDNHELAGNEIMIIRSGKHVSVDTGSQTMSTVEIFDIAGRSIYTKNTINQSVFATEELHFAQQVLLVMVTLDDNNTITRKVLLD